MAPSKDLLMRLCDDTDQLLLTPRETMVVKQATAANDNFPAPHGSQQDEEAIFSGLGEVRSARSLGHPRLRVLSRGVNKYRAIRPPTHGHARAGVIPGLNGLGEVLSARSLGHPANRILSRGVNKYRAIRPPTRGRAHAGVIPGLNGVDDADAENLDGLGAAPARLKAKVAVHRGAAADRPRGNIPAGRGAGPFPGIGDFNIAGIGLGTLAIAGAIGYFLLRRRR